MSKILSKRNLFALAVLLASIVLVSYFGSRPKLAPGQMPLADIHNTETLRTQFNQDAGKVRLIILVAPT